MIITVQITLLSEQDGALEECLCQAGMLVCPELAAFLALNVRCVPFLIVFDNVKEAKKTAFLFALFNRLWSTRDFVMQCVELHSVFDALF